MYVVTRDELYLVPTAEVPVTNLHRDEILDAAELPIRYAAYTPCFRREAGAAGKDTRGILRVHQFDKVEMVQFEKPEDVGRRARVADRTRRGPAPAPRAALPRAAHVHAATWASSQAKKYDLEVWAPGVERWLEVSSCSNFGDYQARRMAIRYRPEAGRQAGARPHAQRLGPGPAAHRRRDPRDVPAARTARSWFPRCSSPTWAATRSPLRPPADEALVRGRRVDRGAGRHVPAQAVGQRARSAR